MQVLSVDYRAAGAPARLERSLRETGFAVVTGHPVPAATIEAAYAEWEAFFRSEEKHRYTFDPERQDGYFPFRSENAKDHPQKDLKEFFHVYPRTTLPAGLSGASRELYAALSSLAGELLG